MKKTFTLEWEKTDYIANITVKDLDDCIHTATHYTPINKVRITEVKEQPVQEREIESVILKAGWVYEAGGKIYTTDKDVQLHMGSDGFASGWSSPYNGISNVFSNETVRDKKNEKYFIINYKTDITEDNLKNIFGFTPFMEKLELRVSDNIVLLYFDKAYNESPAVYESYFEMSIEYFYPGVSGNIRHKLYFDSIRQLRGWLTVFKDKEEK